MEFGELVQWRTRPIGSGGDHGVFLGVKGKTVEIVIGARSGIFKARTVRRRSTEDRWNPKAMELVTGVPWRTSEDDDKVDGDKIAMLQVPEEAIHEHDEDVKKERERAHESMPRSFFITTKDMEQHGYSAKCPGGASVTRQAHSAACRMRFGEILKSTEKYTRVEEKFDQHVARALERQDEEDRKRRKVEQEKAEAAGTLDARESELMEETREKRPAEEEAERDNKRSPLGERRDISMELDGLDGEEIEEDELHIASLEADADEDFGGEEVGDPEFEEEFHENRTGEYLNPELVTKARSEEVEFMAKIGLYQEVDITECLEITGRPPISTRWVDVNKGSTESPNVRCRLVARDFKPKGEKDRSDIFAAMPPLEAKKLLF